ncbi:MAG: hypothetical protein OEZ06_30875 [Myxococcales bacterium]|nr:hypothetical protein [Myxococcales bacterium]
MIDPSARVHPTAILDGEITIGAETEIGPFCYIEGRVVIGARNRIFPHVVIGTDPQHRTAEPTGPVLIGDDNVLRERVTVQRGTGDRSTEIRNGCYLMEGVHVSHDILIDDGVTIAASVTLAGHTVLLEGANLGMGAITHQFTTVGAYSMVGMGAIVTKDVPPLAVVAGNPAKLLRINGHVFEALGIEDGAVELTRGSDGVPRAITYRHGRLQPLLARFRESTRRKTVVVLAGADGA